jgi:hypothetical protein
MRETEPHLISISEARVNIEIDASIVAALGHFKRCDNLLSGRCHACDELQRFWADARAIVEPLQSAPIQETRAQAAPQARLTTSRARRG